MMLTEIKTFIMDKPMVLNVYLKKLQVKTKTTNDSGVVLRNKSAVAFLCFPNLLNHCMT
jgi:hypothetical protein